MKEFKVAMIFPFYWDLVKGLLAPVRLQSQTQSAAPSDCRRTSDALASIDDATTLTASPHSAALQTENSFCVIWLKVNDTLH